MVELLSYLLDHQHRIPNGAIVDALNLAQMAPDPEQRISSDVLALHLRCSTQGAVSIKLARLKELGLVEYERGHCGMPGYLFTRVGPHS